MKLPDQVTFMPTSNQQVVIVVRDTVLDLADLNLKSLPEEIGNLTWLSELDEQPTDRAT
jgi:hypothetical protein